MLGGASAQSSVVHNVTSSQSIRSVIQTGRDLRPTAAEIRMAAGLGTGTTNSIVRRVAVTAGRAMPWIGMAVIAWELVDKAMWWNARERATPVLGPNDDVNCQFGLLPPEECVLSVGDVAFTYIISSYSNAPDVCGQDGIRYVLRLRARYAANDTWRSVSGSDAVILCAYGPQQAFYNIELLPNMVHPLNPSIAVTGPGYAEVTISGDTFIRPVYWFLDGWNEEESVPWRQQLAEGRPGMEQWAKGNTDAFMENRALEQGWPSTYGEPLPGLSLTPSPNINQWYSNPYADPNLDTDGDGYKDWEEFVAGTDPNNSNEHPSTDIVEPEPDPSDPNYDPEEPYEPLPDRDGDGIPDQYDPCPYDALNRCMDDDRVRERLEIEFPDDYSREATLQDIRNLLQQMLEQEQGQEPEEPEEPEEEPAPVDFGPISLVLPEWQPWDITEETFSNVSSHMETVLGNALDAGSGKLPFLFSGWVPIVSLGGGGSCEGISMQLLGVSQDVGVCDTPVHTVLATTVRTALLAVMIIAFWLGMTRWVAQT